MRSARRFVAILGWLASAAAIGDTSLPAMIDAHAHYSAPDAADLAPEAVLARLDAAGVERMVVTSSPPQLARDLFRHLPDRVIPLLGVYESDLHKGDWVRDTGLPARVEAALGDGKWAGIGELHLFARDAQQPVFAQLVQMAARHGLVLMIHGDVEVIERAFAIAPEVRVLWAHLGTEPRPDVLEAMLARYPDTLWIDTSVRDERIAPKGTLIPAWRALFERFPERFVVAVDTFSVNRWNHYEAVVAHIRSWVDPLPQPLRDNLLHDNAARLFESFLRTPARR
ncbi:MAG: amidohydrolase family protein [Thiobacillus sp.]|nr:amidohydrolase family protein [Thiobacillus sp.]